MASNDKGSASPAANASRAGPFRFLSLRRSSSHGYHMQVPNKKKTEKESRSQHTAVKPVRREEVKFIPTPSFGDVREELSRKSWYWGNVSGPEAADILCEMPDHSFLVRDSSDSRSLFAITYRTTGGAIGSTRLQFRAGKFSLSFGNDNMPSFSSIVDLVEHCIELSRTRPVFLVRIGQAQHYVYLKLPLMRNEPLQLQELCRRTVHKHFPREMIERPESGIPFRMKTFLLSCPFRPPDGSKVGPLDLEPVETEL